MKILLTGATGFLGSRTLESLLEREDVESILATGRVLSEERTLHSSKLNYELGDLADEDFVGKLGTNFTHMIHCAAKSSPWGSKQEFYEANVQSTINLIALARKSEIKNFVFISTPSIYFNFKDRLHIKESDSLPAHLVNEYAKTKFQAEQEIKASGLPFVILRPRAIIGRGDSVIMPRLIRGQKEGRLKIIGNGENTADLTSVVNIVHAINLALNPPSEAQNQDFNITNGESKKLWAVISDVLKAIHLDPPRKKVSLRLVLFIARILELISKLKGGKEPTFTRYSVATLAVSMTFDISKAKEFLGYQPKMNTQEGVEEFVNWYNQNERA